MRTDHRVKQHMGSCGAMREKVMQRSGGAGSLIRVKSKEKDIRTTGMMSIDTILRRFTVEMLPIWRGKRAQEVFCCSSSFFFFLRLHKSQHVLWK